MTDKLTTPNNSHVTSHTKGTELYENIEEFVKAHINHQITLAEYERICHSIYVDIQETWKED